MQRLKECLNLSRKITDISDKIEELEMKVKSPKNQIITGMPRGGGGSTLDDLIEKIEKLAEKKKMMVFERKELWDNLLQTMQENGVKKEDTDLIKHRFYYGNKWGKCAIIMNNNYPMKHWNTGKCFRVYRLILEKCKMTEKCKRNKID